MPLRARDLSTLEHSVWIIISFIYYHVSCTYICAHVSSFNRESSWIVPVVKQRSLIKFNGKSLGSNWLKCIAQKKKIMLKNPGKLLDFLWAWNKSNKANMTKGLLFGNSAPLCIQFGKVGDVRLHLPYEATRRISSKPDVRLPSSFYIQINVKRQASVKNSRTKQICIRKVPWTVYMML